MNSGKLLGVGNDLKHQIIIAYIVHALIEKFKKGKYQNYLPLPELPLGKTDKRVPDIIIYKTLRKKIDSPVVLIEVCWPQQINAEIEKLTDIMSKNNTIKESFIIDKESLVVKRIYRAANNKISQPREHSKIEL